MRKTLRAVLVLFFAFFAAGGALPVLAANAEFQGNCTNISGTPLVTDCYFDPTRTPSGSSPTSCSPAAVTNYLWDYGDGSSLLTASSARVWHRYSGEDDWNVCLYVLCSDATYDTTCHCMINYIGINGCILPGAGWTP